MSPSTSTEQGIEHAARENPSSPAAGSHRMTNSSKAPVKPGELENHGPRDSESSGVQTVEKRVKKHAQALIASVRRTVQDVWELGDALLDAKAVIAHGHWERWLREVGVHPRLAQRCMAFRRRVEKRPVSEIKSINTALRMVPAGSTIDAEFEEATSPNDGPKPKEPPRAVGRPRTSRRFKSCASCRGSSLVFAFRKLTTASSYEAYMSLIVATNRRA